MSTESRNGTGDKHESTYAAMLRQASGPVPDASVDWDAFYDRLAARAELSLARLRYPHVAATAASQAPAVRPLPVRTTHPWWEHAARWSPLIVTASVAAGIALVAVVRMSPKEAPEAVVTTGIVATSVGGSDPLDRRRAAFESAATGRPAAWTIESALLPSATDLLIPLGKGVQAP